MKIIGIESASLTASAAVLDEETVIAEYTVNYKKTHSQTLLPMLEEILRMTEQDLSEIDAIAVSGGPGSFTGLRIGSATAKGLGLALEKPLVHVPTLEAMAWNLWGSRDLVCPILDARRGQVYGGLFAFDEENRLVTVKETEAAEIGVFLAEIRRLGRKTVFLGDGVPVFRQTIEAELGELADFAPPHLSRQRAAAVAARGLVLFREGKTVSAAGEAPDYFRVSQAERERKKRLEAQSEA